MSILEEFAEALTGGRIEVVDLTAPLSDRTPIIQLPPPFAQTATFELEEISRFDERGPAWYWNNFSTGEHTGTHFDAPAHWITGRDGEDVATVPARKLVGPAAVLDFSDENGPHTPGISPACSRWLAEEAPVIGLGVETVGTDAGTAHSFDPPFPCHAALLGSGKYGLTQLRNLAQLPPTGALLVAAPLPIVGGSGSPARVLALIEK
jgi:kynurenine formamidase